MDHSQSFLLTALLALIGIGPVANAQTAPTEGPRGDGAAFAADWDPRGPGGGPRQPMPPMQPQPPSQPGRGPGGGDHGPGGGPGDRGGWRPGGGSDHGPGGGPGDRGGWRPGGGGDHGPGGGDHGPGGGPGDRGGWRPGGGPGDHGGWRPPGPGPGGPGPHPGPGGWHQGRPGFPPRPPGPGGFWPHGPGGFWPHGHGGFRPVFPQPQFDPCAGEFVGRYEDGQPLSMWVSRTGGNQVSLQVLVDNQWNLQGFGTCDVYPDGGAEISVNINGDQHEATIDRGVMNGGDASGYRFTIYRQ